MKKTALFISIALLFLLMGLPSSSFAVVQIQPSETPLVNESERP